MAMAIKGGSMNLKNELIKAGFEDYSDTTDDEAIEFELSSGTEILRGSIRLQKLKESDQTEITIYTESGYEILIGMADAEAG